MQNILKALAQCTTPVSKVQDFYSKRILLLTLPLIFASASNACNFVKGSEGFVGYSAGSNIFKSTGAYLGYLVGGNVFDVQRGMVGQVIGNTVLDNVHGGTGLISGSYITSPNGSTGYGTGDDCTPEILGAASVLLF